MSGRVSTRIRSTAGKLGLPRRTETINEYIRRADEGKMGYLDFLDLVLSEDLAVRDDRRFRQGLRLSRLTHHKTLDEYDLSFQPDLDPRKVKDLATLSFVEAKANAALLGPPGVGKTHIAVALAVAACRAGYSIYFTSLDDMFRSLEAADAAGRLLKNSAPTCGPASSSSTRSDTSPSNAPTRTWPSRVISKRYEKGSIILTSNKTFSEWGQVFGDEVLPPPSSTASSTTAKSSPSTVPATGSRTASRPSSERTTWLRQQDHPARNAVRVASDGPHHLGQALRSVLHFQRRARVALIGHSRDGNLARRLGQRPMLSPAVGRPADEGHQYGDRTRVHRSRRLHTLPARDDCILRRTTAAYERNEQNDTAHHLE